MQNTDQVKAPVRGRAFPLQSVSDARRCAEVQASSSDRRRTPPAALYRPAAATGGWFHSFRFFAQAKESTSPVSEGCLSCRGYRRTERNLLPRRGLDVLSTAHDTTAAWRTADIGKPRDVVSDIPDAGSEVRLVTVNCAQHASRFPDGRAALTLIH